VAQPRTRLHDFATDVLTAVVDAFAAAAVDLPARRYVAHGEVAYDCDQLVVGLERFALGLPGAEDQGVIRAPVSRTAIFAVHLLRCVPVPDKQGNPPTPDALDDSSLELMVDAWLLLTGVLGAYNDSELSTRCDSLAIAGLDPYGPQGNYGGSVLRIGAQV
jgi:hypothetical protein